MNEETVRFGRSQHLVGTFTLPGRQDATSPPRVVALLTNAGVISRIGPRRINVKIAQRLAQSNIPSFRWDLSGLGDSGRSSQGGPAGEDFILDTRDAMEAASKAFGISVFIMIGFCSGAHVAFCSALRDDRLRGLVLFDHILFKTSRSTINWWLQRCKMLGLRGLLPALYRDIYSGLEGLRGTISGAKEASLQEYAKLLTRSEYAKLLQALLNRGVRIFFMYSGGFPRIFNYPDQFQDLYAAFDIPRHVESVFLPNADHLITSIGQQNELIELISAWVSARTSEMASDTTLAWSRTEGETASNASRITSATERHRGDDVALHVCQP